MIFCNYTELIDKNVTKTERCNIRNILPVYKGSRRKFNMADDTDKSDFTDDDAISGNDNPSSSKQAQHKGTDMRR